MPPAVRRMPSSALGLLSVAAARSAMSRGRSTSRSAMPSSARHRVRPGEVDRLHGEKDWLKPGKGSTAAPVAVSASATMPSTPPDRRKSPTSVINGWRARGNSEVGRNAEKAVICLNHVASGRVAGWRTIQKSAGRRRKPSTACPSQGGFFDRRILPSGQAAFSCRCSARWRRC